jgi:hypothetical protein
MSAGHRRAVAGTEFLRYNGAHLMTENRELQKLRGDKWRKGNSSVFVTMIAAARPKSSGSGSGSKSFDGFLSFYDLLLENRK